MVHLFLGSRAVVRVGMAGVASGSGRGGDRGAGPHGPGGDAPAARRPARQLRIVLLWSYVTSTRGDALPRRLRRHLLRHAHVLPDAAAPFCWAWGASAIASSGRSPRRRGSGGSWPAPERSRPRAACSSTRAASSRRHPCRSTSWSRGPSPHPPRCLARPARRPPRSMREVAANVAPDAACSPPTRSPRATRSSGRPWRCWRRSTATSGGPGAGEAGDGHVRRGLLDTSTGTPDPRRVSVRRESPFLGALLRDELPAWLSLAAENEHVGGNLPPPRLKHSIRSRKRARSSSR